MRVVRNRGVGKSEVVAFIAVLAVAAMAFMYFNQKPTVIEHTVVVQPPPSPAPAPIAPPVVVAAPPPKVEAPPPKPVEVPLKAEAIVAKPEIPACVHVQEKIRVSITVIHQLEQQIEADKKAALMALTHTPDYQQLQDQIADKKKAKDDAVTALQADRESGADTDQDLTNVKTTSADWIQSSSDLVKMQNDAQANDPSVMNVEQDLKSTKLQLIDFEKQLNGIIVREISPLCDDASCHINNIFLDPARWVLHVNVTPSGCKDAGKSADVAMNCIGIILETLHRSPFTWDTLDFRVCDENKNVNFQLEYQHSTIAETKFEETHEISLLYNPLFVSLLRVGESGMLIDARISQIVDEENMIVNLGDDINYEMPVWVRGVSTVNHVDNSNVDIDEPLKIVGTIRYDTVMGATRTVYLLEPTGFNQNIVHGVYFDNSKLADLAQRIWLNPRIDAIQGRQALPNSYAAGPGVIPPKLVNTLQIGGYARDDGTPCPQFQLHTPHIVQAALPDLPVAKTPPMPGPYSDYNPMIITPGR